MSANKFQPHLFVLPEDDANRQIMNGFSLDPMVKERTIDIREEAGGWRLVIERFCQVYAPEMARYPERLMLLLIDLDGRAERLEDARSQIPEDLRDRVFVMGTFTEPEDLRHDLGTYEKIGLALAQDCRESTIRTWSHRLLKHNEPEMIRLRNRSRHFLFSNQR